MEEGEEEEEEAVEEDGGGGMPSTFYPTAAGVTQVNYNAKLRLTPTLTRC